MGFIPTASRFSIRDANEVAVNMAPRRSPHVEAISLANSTCLDLWNSANATDLRTTMAPQLSALEKATKGGPGNAPLDWALTINAPGVSQNRQQFDNIVWLGTAPDVNLQDGNNPFSACGMVFTDLPLNTLERGQSEDGTCTHALDSNCVSALTAKAADIAQSLTADCTPGANSNCSITDICPTIFSQLGTQTAFVPECVPYFDIGNDNEAWPSANVTAITSNAGDLSKTTCAIQPQTSNKYTYTPAFNLTTSLKQATGNPDHNSDLYNNLTSNVYPILSVFMPPANGSRTAAFQNATAQMTCLRASRFSDGSSKPPALPAPTPVVVPETPSASPGLTGAQIAGIVIGCLAFVILLAAAAWYMWRRRRIARDRAEATRMAVKEQTAFNSGGMTSSSVMSGNQSNSQNPSFISNPFSPSGSNELPPESMNSQHQAPVELPPDSIARPVEMYAAYQPAEVAANEARVRTSLTSPPTAGLPIVNPARQSLAESNVDSPSSAHSISRSDSGAASESPGSLYSRRTGATSMAETPVSAYPLTWNGREPGRIALPASQWPREPQRPGNRGWMTPLGTPLDEEPRDI